jgi:hypothetical protein
MSRPSFVGQWIRNYSLGPVFSTTLIKEDIEMATAIDKNQIKNDVDAVWEMDDQEVYRLLGLAQMGTNSVTEAKKSMGLIMSVAANTDADDATASVSTSLEKQGKTFLKKVWAEIKGIVCQIYNEKLQIDGKDLAAYLVAAIAAAVSISHALLVLVITLMVKRGLKKMCAIN